MIGFLSFLSRIHISVLYYEKGSEEEASILRYSAFNAAQNPVCGCMNKLGSGWAPKALLCHDTKKSEPREFFEPKHGG